MAGAAKMKRKTELLFLAAILLLVVSQQFYVLYNVNPTAGVFSSDYWSHVISMRQYDAEQYINYETSWTNIFRLEGDYKYYPPGFSLLVNSLRETTSLSYYEVNVYLSGFWVFFCLIIYLLAKNILN